MSIFEKLIKVQTELKAPKNQRNSFGNYNYRSCEDILEAVKPLLAENKLSLMLSDKVMQIGERYYIKAVAILIDVEDGRTIENVAYAREEETKKGADGSQITGASSSYARKYALNGLFLIDDTKDSDSTNDHGKNEEQQKAPEKNGSKKLSDAQVKRLCAIAYSKGYKTDEVKALAIKKFNKTDLKDLSKEEYETLVKGYESLNKKE